MNITFLCNTDQKIGWFHLLQRDNNQVSFLNYGEPKINSETLKTIKDLKPDVIHLHWREHRDPRGTFEFIRKLKTVTKAPLMLQLDYQPRYLVDQDLEFARLGNLLVSENILVEDFPRQPGVNIQTCYVGADEWGENCDILFCNGSWIKFKDVYDKLAGNPTVFGKGGFMDYDKETKKYNDYTLNISKVEDRKRLWATCWHDRPEMPMDDKFTIMKIVGKDYKCRWFNGWEANKIHQMYTYADGHEVPRTHYEAYEWMGLGYWEKLSECICSVDNMYWGTCSLGMESAVFKIPLTGNSLCTTATILNPKLVTDDLKKQAEIVVWLLDNPDSAAELGQEAYDNYIEHYSLENKLKRFNTALKMIGI